MGKQLEVLLLLSAVLLVGGCTEDVAVPTRLAFKDGTVLTCEQGYSSHQAYKGGTGICYHADGTRTQFTWLGETNISPLAFYALVPVLDERKKEGWKLMESFDSLVAKIEGAFERWIGEFEQRPFSVGLRVLLAFVLIRFLYRKILK